MKCPHCGTHILSRTAELLLGYMREEATKRGGFMFEGARQAYEAGTYKDDVLAELLAAEAIAPHPDPTKGWVVKP